MRRIVKRPEPAELIAWKRPWEAQTGSYRERSWDALQGSEKRALLASLITEQGRVCCYCERRITDTASHIEHFRPQGNHNFPELRFEYANLHASCSSPEAAEKPPHDLICGTAKGDQFDERKLISPLEADCADLFRYFANGEIRSRLAGDENQRAEYTIRVLRLDAP